jgi:hypothetical protein
MCRCGQTLTGLLVSYPDNRKLLIDDLAIVSSLGLNNPFQRAIRASLSSTSYPAFRSALRLLKYGVTLFERPGLESMLQHAHIILQPIIFYEVSALTS